MGGGISFELFARMRERVAGMVLISTGAVLPVSDVVFELLEKDYATFCKFLVKLSYSKSAPEMITSLALKELESMNKALVANDFAICNRFDYRALLSSIDVPVLIIANRGDKMVPPENAEEMARGIRGSKLVLFENTGHMPYLENHARVNEEIDGFLKKVLAKVPTT
jgi:pimeloyl-ACP methyl ester carboxylesterase